MSACTPDCWTPVICPECARPVAPRGRAVHMEAAGLYCDWYEPCVPGFVSPQHLWDEHDDARAFIDREGWDEHVASCESCRGAR